MIPTCDFQSIPISERAAIVRDVARGVAGDAIQIRGLLALLSEANPPPIIESLNRQDAGPAAWLVQHSLMTRLFLWTCRAYGKVRKVTDRHAQVAFDLMRDRTLLEQIELHGSAKILTQAREKWARCRADDRLTRLNRVRDKELAHRAKPNSSAARAVWGPSMEFCAQTANAMGLLALGVGTAGDLNEQVQSFKQAAANFWSPWGRT